MKKKMSKFRKWLIHKLGGLVPEDKVKYEVVNKRTQPIKCVITVSENEMRFLENDEEFKEYINRSLKRQLAEGIAPYVKFSNYTNPSSKITYYEGIIEIVLPEAKGGN